MTLNAGTKPLLSVRALEKSFGKTLALGEVSFDVAEGEFVALLGPSGCGKTTLLRCIGGFLPLDKGSIVLAGQEITKLPPHRRSLNTVFQNYALFPHMTVLENVAFGPRRRGLSRAEAGEQAGAALALVGLDHLSQRLPAELSGGQQQRVALARALVNQPKLLLLDEPLAALDLQLRKRMQLELKHLQEKLGIAFILVTHDQEEAMSMADTVMVMNTGRVEQAGSGPEIYNAPATQFVAEFIGEANLIPCTWHVDGSLHSDIGMLPTPPRCGIAGRTTAVIRPEHVQLIPPGGSAGPRPIRGQIRDIVDVGSHTSFHIHCAGTVVVARVAGRNPGHSIGDMVALRIEPRHVHLIPA